VSAQDALVRALEREYASCTRQALAVGLTPDQAHARAFEAVKRVGREALRELRARASQLELGSENTGGASGPALITSTRGATR
jgi:hypothetical protein